MKKFAALALAFAIAGAALPAEAAKPAGLKDVEQTASAESVDISIPALNKHNIIESKSFDVNVTMLNVGITSKSYSIQVFCGDKLIASDQAIAEANTSAVKTVKVKDCDQGPQKIRVDVKSGGKKVSSNEYDINIIVPYQNQFMDWASGRGLCGYNSPYYWNLVGWQSPRTGNEWNSIEKTAGVYNFSGWESEFAPYRKKGNRIVYLVTYNNPIYNGRTDIMARQYGPKTKEEFDAYAKYAAKVAELNPDIKYFELYNEPNIGFWKPNPNVDDYTYLCEVTAREIKKVRPDAVVTVGSMAGANAAFPLNMLRRNAYSSMDCISYHPYVYPAKADISLQNSISGIHDLILTEGGWKEGIVTELGWPTHLGGTGISEDQQSIEFVKAYILLESNGVKVSQMYRMNDPGKNKEFNEDNFGMMRYDGSPKPTITSVKELNQRTQGGIYMGEIELANNMKAYMYLVDQRLEVVAWNKAGSENAEDSANFGTNLTAYDRYGNYASSGSEITLGESPVYLEGFSNETIAKNLYYNVKKSLDHSKTKLSYLAENKGFNSVMNMLYEKAEGLKLDKMPTEAEAKECMDEYYGLAKKVCQMYKSGELECEIKDLSSILYMIYLSAKPINNLYLASVNSSEAYSLQNAGKVKAARAEITKKADDGTLSYSEAVIKFAEETLNDANVLAKSGDQSQMKCGVLKAWDALAGYTADIALDIAEDETKEYNNILMQIPSTEAVIETNIPKTFNMSLYNYSPKTISGKVELVSPSGEVLGTTENVTLASGENLQLPLKALIETLEKDSDAEYTLRFVQNGETLKISHAPIKVKVSLDVRMTLVETNFDGINSVSVDLENLTNELINATVEIKAPEGWKLSGESQNVTLEGNKTNKVTFGVSQKTAVPYHFYTFEVTVKNQAGKTIFYNKLPLTFTQIVKAEHEYSTSSFDGDISDWADAYPIYLGLPEDVTSYEDWQQSDVAARVLTKWDSKYLYLLVDVFDNSHINGKMSGQIWDGDCVQVSIDPNNDKDDKKYETEDYEYGFAYTDMQGNVSYSWYANGHKAGDEPSDYSVMMRDNQTKLSRYLIRLPQSAVTPLTLREGSEFGYNIAVNDADFTSRERLIEYVPGTAASKSPSVYPTYVLTGSEEAPTGNATCPIPSGMKAGDIDSDNTGESFVDIDGHWAKNMIEAFAKRGYVKGIGSNNFAPDKKVSRAEFITMITNVAGIGEKQQQQISMFAVENEGEKPKAPKSYFDVERDAWYAQNVYDAKKAGIISSDVADAYFYPDKDISREEVCSVIDAYLVTKGDNAANIKAINAFSDSGEVSDWALKSVMNLYGLGILQGDGAGKIKPKATLTRAEAVAFLTALLNN